MYSQEAVSFPSKTATRRAHLRGSDDWWVLYLPALLITACIVWWECLPVYIGYALSIFALAAVIGVARMNVSSFREKCIWGMVCLSSLSAEGGIAYRAHVRGQGFLVCHFSSPGVAKVEYQGPSTLRSGFMQIVDESDLEWLRATLPDNGEVWFKAYQHVPLGVFSTGVSKAFAVKNLQWHQGTVRYRIQFSSENDSWWEDYQSVLHNGKPLQALRIMRYVHGEPSTVYQEVDEDYPRDRMNKVSWAWARTEP